jgi:PhzF family phenazine biosynthesis protein
VTEIRLRTVDAFTERPFSGNPAAVVMLDEAPPDGWMLALAREMRLSDTAFVIRDTPSDADFSLRWFTPTMEVDLCGHATLASAHCLLEDGVACPIRFVTRSGILTITRRGDDSLAMDFPAGPPKPIDHPSGLADSLDAPVEWVGRSGNNMLLCLLADERTIRELAPDIAGIAHVDALAVIVTAVADVGRPYDFVSRVFAPNAGIDEDPVTGSAHTVLAPFWADRLDRQALVGLQASARSGFVGVECTGDRVIVLGKAVTVTDGLLRVAAHPS